MVNHSWLAGFQEFCLLHKLPFVSYRLPGEKKPVTLISNSGIREFKNTDTGRSGFLLAPFLKNKIKLWLSADQVIYGDDTSHFNLDAIDPGVMNQSRVANDDLLPEATPKQAYFDKINLIKQSIDSGRLNKAVLSRPLLIEFSRLHETPILFKDLLNTLPSAFVCFLSFPGAGTWLGASPELLLQATFNSMDEDALIQTMALAGTRKKGTSLEWGLKEIDEQEWVSKDISQKLQNAGCKHIEQSRTHTLPAGNVEHIITDYKATIKRTQIMHLAEELHPTPAVCGWPSDKALELIRSVEDHDRMYYSGYLGPVNLSNQTSLFVNLRCMKIAQNKAALYVGGGITSDSDPESEWEETVIKSRTLLAEIEKIRNLAS